MKVFSILLILLLAYIAVSDASPSPQSPDTDGMVEGDSQSRLKRGIDDITSFGRDKREIISRASSYVIKLERKVFAGASKMFKSTVGSIFSSSVAK
ncbi:uncharacterized protein LOC123682471 isoform X10 [Harmonia axyridis]|uniref:uncharacterized protein LOC123682471 isoform X10 n=1 Tax=Harmonia axyridis TaxID=115357 RepID=UPI001E277BC1|nr:uncharacterized protein LOC123682471 isoform X10 [Harmonia axyridis]XP_045477053.1 uncharacterized protein LOC123682471 isoform X10 [Harmonia axyridis]